jgi:hypothetical protein
MFIQSFTKEEYIAALEAAGLEYNPNSPDYEDGEIKWQHKFNEIEEELGEEIGFTEFMACEITDTEVWFTSIQNEENLEFKHHALEDAVRLSKMIIEKFYRDLV